MNPVEILIADDHELFRHTVRSFIESHSGYRVCGEAGDGIEAIEKVRELSPDIVLMDINMPRMDGLEAARIIRREMAHCKVIIVTQNHATIAREQARNVDAKGAITKSDLTRDLFSTIERVLGRANPQTQNDPGDAGTTTEGWLRGGGALARLVQEFDWMTTPLGAVEHWPQSLKTIVRTMLTSRFAMWMSWGPELTFLYNDAYAKMTLGKKHPWALGKPSQKVWEEIWDDIGPRIRKVLDTGESTWDEALMLFLERSGYREETYHTFSYSPLSGDDGNATGHLCVVTEETDRVIGERRLKTLRTLATELSQINTEEDVVTSVTRSLSENELDLPFTLTYLVSENGKQARLACHTGITAGHRGVPEIIELADRNQAWPIQEILNGKDSVVVDDLRERFDSVPSGAWDRPPTRALLLPITSQAPGSPAGVLIAALNPYRPLDVNYAGFLNLLAGQISASIANARAYDAEKQRAEALAEIDRAKTVFFSNVSHEFRTPLTLMLAPLEDMLAAPDGLAAHHQERLGIAHRNSLRLLKLVNTLLDFSRIEAGRFQASYEPTDLPQLTVELASVFRSAVERAGLRFVVNCPSLDEPVYVDRELWEKIVFNLLSNAFKFTFDGEIEISTRKTDAGVDLMVRDTGIGIPEDDLPHLFERFYRVKDARGRTFEGSGIGLALVQELAQQHGGTVRAESASGTGSTFTVTLPLGKDHLPADRIGAHRTLASTALRGETYAEEAIHWLPHAPQELPSVSTLVPSGVLDLQTGEDRPRILLADDNSDMREYVQTLLASSCEVQALADGEAALEAIREHPPDLILSDIMMPKLDGFGLLKEVRSDDRVAGIPVILISARAGEESRVEGLSAGADDYLTKPFSARELLARVKSQLAMAKVRRQAAQLERELREHAEAEADGLAKMNEWGWRLWRSPDLIEGLNETLGAVIALLGADKGVLQLLDSKREVLAIAAQRGFEHEFLDFFCEVTADTDSSSGRALRKNERFIVEDIEQDPLFAPFRPIMRKANVRSVVSIPLIMADGSVLGMLSAYFSHVHRPTEQDLRRLDLYIRQAADFIRRCRTDEALRRSEEQFRKLSETLDVEVRARTRALEQQSQQVRELSWRLLRSQDEERRHIARELHDSAGQILTVLGINLAQLIQEAGRNAPKVAAKIEQIQETVQLLHREIRTTSYLLHPPLLDENGLYSAVSWYVQGLLERSGLDIRLDIPKDFGRLPRDVELVIFRFVQECLTNIHRHAESATALIRMVHESNLITIEIRDQGKGISPERLAEIQSRRSGVGIRGMRERLRQFDGTMNIESEGGSGTRVTATIPVPKATSSAGDGEPEPLQQPA